MVDKDVVRAGYDAITERYDEVRAEDGDDLVRFEALLDGLDEDSRLLDAGCGQGVPVLARAGASVDCVGLDLSGGQLSAAAETAPAAALVQGDMTDLPFGSDSFDAVTAYYSVIHVPEGDHQAVIDEFARVLRPGGRVLLVEGTDEWHGTNEDWLDAGAEMQWHIDGPAATREQLRAAGFDVVDETVVGDGLADDAAWQVFEGRVV